MKPKGRLTWFTLPETNSKMAPENWSKIGTSLETLGPKHEYSAVQNSHHRTFSRSNSCQSGDTHQMKVPLLGVFVSSLQIRWATKNTSWPGSLIGILISWHITIPTYIGEFFIPNLYPKQPVFLFIAHVIWEVCICRDVFGFPGRSHKLWHHLWS